MQNVSKCFEQLQSFVPNPFVREASAEDCTKESDTKELLRLRLCRYLQIFTKMLTPMFASWDAPCLPLVDFYVCFS